jgi:hypothetical protein
LELRWKNHRANRRKLSVRYITIIFRLEEFVNACVRNNGYGGDEVQIHTFIHGMYE